MLPGYASCHHVTTSCYKESPVQALDAMSDEELLQTACQLAGRQLSDLPQHGKRKRPDSIPSLGDMGRHQQLIGGQPRAHTQVGVRAVNKTPHNVLAARRTSEATPSHSISMQVLEDLPDDLVISVLRASSTPLAKQLKALPQVFHTSALHAAFLNILAARALRVECVGDLGPHLADLIYLAATAGLLQLDLCNSGCVGSVLESLAPHFSSLSSLQHLTLRDNSVGAAGMRALAPRLASLSTLQHLDLGSSWVLQVPRRWRPTLQPSPT